MKIAAFHSDNPFAGWVQCHGFPEILRRMGHEVVDIPVPCRGGMVKRSDAERINKPIDDADLVIVSGPEWLRKWIETFYPQWNSLKMPKIGWYHESFVRDDFTLDYKNYERMFDFHFFPDKEDAEKYKGEWLPLGVDYDIFNPTVGCFYPKRDIPLAFIGLMYPKRAQFVEQLQPHLGDIEIQYRCAEKGDVSWQPSIAVYDFDGLNVRRSAELLAETYRRIQVFVTFPSMSRVIVAKVLETLACGCTLVAPKQPMPLPGCLEYSSPYECAQRIKQALKGTQYTDTPKRIYEQHRMELRFAEIFRKAGVCQESSLLAEADSSATILQST